MTPIDNADEESEDNRMNENDLYDQTDVSDLPSWWRSAIEEHEEYGLRPYKPPRFNDDVLVQPLIERLEREYDIEIQLIGIGVRYGDKWQVRIDGEIITKIDIQREPEGYSQIELESEQFKKIVQCAV